MYTKYRHTQSKRKRKKKRKTCKGNRLDYCILKGGPKYGTKLCMDINYDGKSLDFHRTLIRSHPDNIFITFNSTKMFGCTLCAFNRNYLFIWFFSFLALHFFLSFSLCIFVSLRIRMLGTFGICLRFLNVSFRSILIQS